MNDKEKLETIKGLVDGLDDPDFQGYTPKKSAVFSVALDSFNTIISDFEYLAVRAKPLNGSI